MYWKVEKLEKSFSYPHISPFHMTSPQSLEEAIGAAKKAVQGDFTLNKNLNGNSLTTEEQGYLTVYNSH